MQVKSRPLCRLQSWLASKELTAGGGGSNGGIARGGNVPDQPEETLGGGVLLGGQLVLDELLDGGRLAGGSELTFAELL